MSNPLSRNGRRLRRDVDADHQTRALRIIELVLEDAPAAAASVEHGVARAHVLVDDVGEAVVHTAEVRWIEAVTQLVLAPAE
jgi:hypothetical protein